MRLGARRGSRWCVPMLAGCGETSSEANAEFRWGSKCRREAGADKDGAG
jgi:hypothetical protein